MDNKKYELTEETKSTYGIILHRIKALGDFGYVKAGDIGGTQPPVWLDCTRTVFKKEEVK